MPLMLYIQIKKYPKFMNSSSRVSKKDAKQEKINTKQQQSLLYNRKQPEQDIKHMDDDKNQYANQDPILKRAIKWWNRIDSQYYKSITLEQAINRRDIFSSNQLLMITDPQYSTFVPYRNEMISNVMPSILDKNKIKVMYKTKYSYTNIMAIYSIQAAIPNYHSQSTHQTLDLSSIKITYHHNSNHKNTENYMHPQTLSSSMDIKTIRLSLQDYQISQTICNRIQKLAQVQNNTMYKDQIQQEIALWEYQLQRVNQENYINWNKLICNMQINKEKLIITDFNQFEQQILRYKDKLHWGTILRSFQHGFSDKTRKMLDIYIQNEKNFSMRPPKGIAGHNAKKLFQTDCKICFSSDNNDSNQVLYCDSCNTSFHLLCYGLTSIPRQDKYFCERCTYIRKQQNLNPNTKYKKPYCQICLKTAFPMKKLDEHFYHVTCLMLFNFIQFRQNKMVLRGSLTHQNIIKMVIQNQIMHDQCNECRKLSSSTQLGMQIKCSYEGCQNYVHPICGYLNGYKFQLKSTIDKKLNVRMFCNEHLGSRIQQVYFRRYLCNLNETSSKTYNQFKTIFQAQQQSLVNAKENLQKNRKKYPNRILMLTKFIKNYMKIRSGKEEQQQLETQTQAILRKLKNKNHISH